MCNSPSSPRASARTCSTDSSASFKIWRVFSRKTFPSAVRTTPRGLRLRRSTPISSSRSWTRRLSAGCATRKSAAAFVKFNASATARKYRKCRSSIADHYAKTAWLRKHHGIGKIQTQEGSLRQMDIETTETTNNESQKMIMKAIRIHQYGGPEVLAQVEMQRPTPGPDEVLIKVHAAAVNPVDWKMRAGYMKDFLPLSLPATLGSDISGTVEGVGPGAARFKRGDEVYASLGLEGGGYAEYAVAKETIVAEKPGTLDHVQAASVPVAGLTAWQTLFEVTQLRAGQKVLIHGAAGGVGNFAVQFAKAKGAYVIGTASSKNHAFLHELGADKAVDYQQTRFEDVVRDAGAFVQSASARDGADILACVLPPNLL